MARRTLTFTEWMTHLRRSLASPDRLGDLGGHPIDDVATKLGVTKQAVHLMIDTDKLDAIEVTTKRGAIAVLIVTQASLDYYLAHRRPYGSTDRFVLTPDSP